MNDDIKKYGVTVVNPDGSMFECDEINSTNDYNHVLCQIHHYIKSTKYHDNKQWYLDRGIEQKLFLLPTLMHLHLENPIHMLTDDIFFEKYHIKKEQLLFNRKTSEY